MIILGIDPGLATTGYGVIKKERGKEPCPLEWGIIATPAKKELADRLLTINRDLKKLIARYHPALAVVESIYFAKNVKTAISVAQARGVILLTLETKKIKILELTPLQMKSQITGYGKAEKRQVQFMVKQQLRLAKRPEPDDAADALALAWCGLTKLL